MVFIEYGQDIDKSKRLIKELGLEKIIFKPMCSKKIRKLMAKADMVFDQLVMNAYSTSCLEAMMCKKPVVMRYPKNKIYKYEFAPIINATTVNEIQKVLKDFFKSNLF